MPTRVIREGILSSEKVNSLSDGAELFYRRLMSVVDDYGRYYAAPGILHGAVWTLKAAVPSPAKQGMELPKSSSKALKWTARMLKEVSNAGLITIYGEGKYLVINNFRQQTRSKSKFPAPPAVPPEKLMRNECKAIDKQMSRVVGVEGGGVDEDGAARGQAVSISNKVEVKERLPANPNPLKQMIGALYQRPGEQPWSYMEESLLAEIARRQLAVSEFQMMVNYRRSLPSKDRTTWFPNSVSSLLQKWNETLDRARVNQKPERKPSAISHQPSVPEMSEGFRKQGAEELRKLAQSLAAPQPTVEPETPRVKTAEA